MGVRPRWHQATMADPPHPKECSFARRVILAAGGSTMANTVGEKGQVVIEKPIREALGIRPGSLAVQVLRDDHVEIRFFPPEHNRSLKGLLADKLTKVPEIGDWREVQEDAWGAAAAEKRRGNP